ncbi:MAG TPA: hypothetical protein DIW44_05310 [Anaerolineaceae bacterium]|nr:hypothetical protein [Anaerolineaceae bacterium]
MKFVKEQCGNDDIEYIFYINYKSIVKCFNKRFRVFSFKLDPRGFDWIEEVSITKPRGFVNIYNKYKNCFSFYGGATTHLQTGVYGIDQYGAGHPTRLKTARPQRSRVMRGVKFT